ncbi:MAG TPA: hypothetical protein PKZ83_15805 [bacterium]|nr:hypothetical protein [bacterium]HQF64037.1 hypothetical protein [Anaerolineaceae bacterium]HQJ66484.1 hypothetical protein [bacterium]
MTDTVIIHGPQACGKTRNVQKLAEKYQCETVVDDWMFCMPLKENALHLTFEEPPKGFKGAAVVDFDTAMKGT